METCFYCAIHNSSCIKISTLLHGQGQLYTFFSVGTPRRTAGSLSPLTTLTFTAVRTPPSLTINLISAIHERRNACKLQAVSRRAGPTNLAVFKLPELFPSLTGALMQLGFSGANCRSRLLYGGGRKVTFHRGASVWAPFK